MSYKIIIVLNILFIVSTSFGDIQSNHLKNNMSDSTTWIHNKLLAALGNVIFMNECSGNHNVCNLDTSNKNLLKRQRGEWQIYRLYLKKIDTLNGYFDFLVFSDQNIASGLRTYSSLLLVSNYKVFVSYMNPLDSNYIHRFSNCYRINEDFIRNNDYDKQFGIREPPYTYYRASSSKEGLAVYRFLDDQIPQDLINDFKTMR